MKFIFVLDTNFFIDYPDFPTSFCFGDEPYAIILCRPILYELDEIKKGNLHSERVQKARAAINTINELLSGKISLPGGKLMLKRPPKPVTPYSTMRFDEEILETAKWYIKSEPDAQVIILTSDKNLQNLAMFDGVPVVNPAEWHFEKLEEREERKVIEQASALLTATALRKGYSRAEAIDELVRLGKGRFGNEVAFRLLEALRDEDFFARVTAAVALGELGKQTDEVIAGLLEALRDEDSLVRSGAVKALRKLGKPTDEVITPCGMKIPS